MTAINRQFGALVDALLWPFHSLPPMVGLAAVSCGAAIVMLLVLRVASNQRAIREVKRRIQAGLFEIRLFNADVRALDSIRDVLRHNLTYLRLSLAPLVWLLVPFALLTSHLQSYYAYDGFVPGDSTVVKVRLPATAVAAGAEPAVALVVPAGIRVETPLIWIPSEREAAWRIGFDDPGSHDIVIHAGGAAVSKRLQVSDRVGRRAPGRYRSAFRTLLFSPAEPPIPADAPIDAVEVTYRARHLGFFGLNVDWLPAFAVLTLMSAWLMRSRFGVDV